MSTDPVLPAQAALIRGLVQRWLDTTQQLIEASDAATAHHIQDTIGASVAQLDAEIRSRFGITILPVTLPCIPEDF